MEEQDRRDPGAMKSRAQAKEAAGRAFPARGAVMDALLWAGLPKDIHPWILARVPAVDLVRFRTVCKQWKTLASSATFHDACRQVKTYMPYFVFVPFCEHISYLTCFDPCEGRWRKIPTACLPSHVGFPVSHSGGLLCLTNMQYAASMRDGCELFVCNAVQKSWRCLPKFDCSDATPVSVTIVMLRQPGHYRVVVVGGRKTRVYDSVEGRWRSFEFKYHDKEFDGRCIMAFCKGSLYCLSSSKKHVIAFKVLDEVWSYLLTERLPGYKKFRTLVASAGHVMIVGKEMRAGADTICLWRLEWETRKWRAVACMPQVMSDAMLEGTGVFHATSNGNRLFISSSKTAFVVFHDMTTGMWMDVPAWPRPQSGLGHEPRPDSKVYQSVLCYEPRLDSKP